MKGEYLLDALEYVDDDIIEKTAVIKISKKKHMWTIWAVAIVLAITVGLLLCIWVKPTELTNTITTADKSLTKLELSFGVEGMRFEGLMFYDISERDDSNPWTADAELETLPVYKNLAYTDVSGMPVYLSEFEMESLANDVAAKLGTEISEIKTDMVNFTRKSGSPHKKGSVYVITAKIPFGKIRVYGNGEVYVSLSESIELPSEYSFTNSDTSDEQAEKTILFLLEQYPLLANLEKPIISTWGDYTFSGEQLRCYTVFDGKGDVTRQILNFNFNQISFDADDNGKLCGYRIKNILSAAEKLGDYPIITKLDAEKLYRKGNFITTVPSDYMPTDEIAKCELVYRTGNGEKTFMPYYRFYVELMGFKAANQAQGLKCYGAYYVPAVRSEYLI